MKKVSVLSLMLAVSILFAACDNAVTTPKMDAWSKAEVDAVRDLSELGELSYSTSGEMIVGGKIVNPDFVTTQFYGKDYDFVDLDEVKPLAAAKGLKVEDLSPSQLEDLQVEAMPVNGTAPTDSQSLAPQAAYNIDASNTDVYKVSCENSLETVRNRAATQSNVSSYYLSVDSSVYKDTSLLKKDYKEQNGPTSGVVLIVTGTYSAPCFNLQTYNGKGWHKGKNTSSSTTLTKNTTDSGRF